MAYDLIAFDIDGTLVRHPKNYTVWEVLNKRFLGTPEINVERYARYKKGELSYADWVALDIGGWREAGATRETILEAFSELSLVPDTRETLDRIAETGARMYVISGTIDVMLHALLPDAPFHEIYCNHLGFEEDGQIAHWRPTPFDMNGKQTLLETLSQREGIPLDRCAYVGDSDNDRWIFDVAGLAIAFQPKTDLIRKHADVIIEDESLTATLPYLL